MLDIFVDGVLGDAVVEAVDGVLGDAVVEAVDDDFLRQDIVWIEDSGSGNVAREVGVIVDEWTLGAIKHVMIVG